MDFEPRYTPEQEEFRREVSAWLKQHVPGGMEHPADPADLTWEQYQLRRELGRKLGDKGWLWPTAPKEYGGGGLDVDSAVVIEEEIDSFGLTLPPYYDSGGRLGGNSILVWGTEEQKAGVSCRPSSPAASRTWQLLSEPEAGSDLANVKTQAIRGRRRVCAERARRYSWAATTAATSCGPSRLPTPRPSATRTSAGSWCLPTCRASPSSPWTCSSPAASPAQAPASSRTVYFDNCARPRLQPGRRR